MLSQRSVATSDAFRVVADFVFASRYGDRRGDRHIADFTFGNPQEMPLPGLVTAIRDQAIPQNKDWFAYKTSEEVPQTFLAERLSRELGLPFEPPDVALTSGAFAAISVAFHLLLDAGDEANYLEPAWFCYEPMIVAANAVPRPVALEKPRFDLDADAIDAAIGPRTRLVIINTPHNPTGRIYDDASLQELAACLERASKRIGRRIFLLADEPYRRLRFDGRGFTSPAAIYPWTLIAYSYGKVLLSPGQRLGYLAISPRMPDADRQALRDTVMATQMALGWCFPNAVMQYAVPQLEGLSIDVRALARRRDAITEALTKGGHAVLPPDGTFYLWVKWGGDSERTWNAFADRDVFVMPGSLMKAHDYFRVCLTASDEMVERALPVFAGTGRP
jgi:aspartate aminotransferase